jgi:hypothetical protein
MTIIATNPGHRNDILSKHEAETTKNIIKKLRGGGRKRKGASSLSHKAKRVKIAKQKSSKCKAPPRTLKETYSCDSHQSLPDHVWRSRVCE